MATRMNPMSLKFELRDVPRLYPQSFVGTQATTTAACIDQIARC